MVQSRIKTKNIRMQEVVIGGRTGGRGRRHGAIGALLLGAIGAIGEPSTVFAGWPMNH